MKTILGRDACFFATWPMSTRDFRRWRRQAEQHFAGDLTITCSSCGGLARCWRSGRRQRLGCFSEPAGRSSSSSTGCFERGVIGATQRALFHDLRRVGNAAVHEGKRQPQRRAAPASDGAQLAVWFQRSFGSNQKFDPGAVSSPPDHSRPKRSFTMSCHACAARWMPTGRSLRQPARHQKPRREPPMRGATGKTVRARAGCQGRKTQRSGKRSPASRSEPSPVVSATAQQSAALQQQNKQLQAELVACPQRPRHCPYSSLNRRFCPRRSGQRYHRAG